MDVRTHKEVNKKRRLFRKEGRSGSSKELKRRMDAMIKERISGFNYHIRDKFINNTDSKAFHKGVKCFLTAEETAQWDARSLLPGDNDLTVAKLADYFNGISQEYEPLDLSTLPTTYDREFPPLTVSGVANRLRKAKKTSSRVKGDIFASLYSVYAEELAAPITGIF